MPPAKHGRNATANPVYSQSERLKDKSSEGYGTQKRRAVTISLQVKLSHKRSSSFALLQLLDNTC